MLTFLLGTLFGKILLGAGVVLVLILGLYVRDVSKPIGNAILGAVFVSALCAGVGLKLFNAGFDSATDHYKAVVAACMSANASQAQAIEQLKAANQAFADAAKAEDAKAAQAVAKSEADAKSNAEALAAAQARLHEIERIHGDAHAAAVTEIPGPVYRAICAGGVCEPADSPH